jgi:hypothetical protein
MIRSLLMVFSFFKSQVGYVLTTIVLNEFELEGNILPSDLKECDDAEGFYQVYIAT